MSAEGVDYLPPPIDEPVDDFPDVLDEFITREQLIGRFPKITNRALGYTRIPFADIGGERFYSKATIKKWLENHMERDD